MNKKGKTTIKDVLPKVVIWGIAWLISSLIFWWLLNSIEADGERIIIRIEYPWNILVAMVGGAILLILVIFIISRLFV